MRELKFRIWLDKASQMVYPDKRGLLKLSNDKTYFLNAIGQLVEPDNSQLMSVVVQQYTGLKDKNGNEIYEGDIFRIEEDDDIFYVVIFWVKEWCMFCSLLVDEYHNYKMKGVKSLDEPMFWTYSLEDTDSRKHFLCGNIYENPSIIAQP